MTETSNAQSVKARLLNLADGNNRQYQQLIVRYLHERFLYRFSKSDYRESFILKGGALLYAYEEFMPRPTIDIDFSGYHIDNSKENLLATFKSIVTEPIPEDGIEFLPDTMTAEEITVDKKYPGVRINLTARIGSYRQALTLDIGFGDILIPKPVFMDYPTLLDMPRPNIMVYSLETVVAEKFHAMIDRGRFNSRMKDFFDLYRIFSAHRFDTELLTQAIRATFKNRGLKATADNDFFNDDFGNDRQLNLQWDNYMRRMKISLPDFPVIHRIISNYLSPLYAMLYKE